MNKTNKKGLVNGPSRSLPVKKVNYQELYATAEVVEQLKSWQEPLNLLTEYFSDKERPINKKKVAREYHACSQLFILFHNDFERAVELMDTQLSKLKNKEKLPPI